MDAQETGVYTAAIITAVVVGGIIIYFIISIIRQQRRNLDLHKHNILAEMSAIEKDRTRIAYDLHDELGPVLSSIKLMINIFDLTDPDDKLHIEKINDSIDRALTRIREISYNLMPAVLISAGLITALKEYVNNINSPGLKINLDSPDTLTLSESKSINIFRIVQEITHNTIKHARANRLDIDFIQEKNKLIVILKDNGIGFEQKEIVNKGGLGLKSLQSRAQLMNGRMFFESKKGSGTEFIFEIPYL
ncbi:MAG TPA: ATP-binding protein [Chitinophagaceae bacterium]